MQRRDFLKNTAGAATIASLPHVSGAQATNSLFHGFGWESLNPGFWQVTDGFVRRRLKNYGDRARRTGFPFHSATNGQKMATEYDPTLPPGIIYRNEVKTDGADWSAKVKFVFHAPRPEPKTGDDPAWKMYQDGEGFMGLAIGAKSLYESYGKMRNVTLIGWSDDGQLRFEAKNNKLEKNKRHLSAATPALKPGDEVTLHLRAIRKSEERTLLAIEMNLGGEIVGMDVDLPAHALKGYVGIVGRGLIDFEVQEFTLEGPGAKANEVGQIDCHSCYPLGDTLKQADGAWQVRFVSLFDADGEKAEIRISDEENPTGGWEKVPIAGSAPIVNHHWRRNTAVIEAKLPKSPSEATLFYTVWKDGKNVTTDPRIGTAAVGPGTGLVGDVPAKGGYVGRLPQLTAPYKLCGLSCHAITSGLQQRSEDGKWKILGGGDDWQVRDQPTVGAYQHLEDYNFQIMVWEDDVWYMELVLYPPSTDDAYKMVKLSICGPTSRWQMMRHWNVINPGDHDYGMDDVKGPEQIAIRTHEGLGQDPSYMRRNFQIVHHLITGDEEVDPLANPKKWRAWKMPNRDFTFVILDSRLWRSSQDTDMWDDAGWDAFKNLYDRTDPTRSLLGEEQFGWLQELLATDSSRQICLTGINGMHTVWAGTRANADKIPFDQRDRVTADYAGWVKAGSDRVLELLGSRDGVVTVYGDVHNGCIMKNVEQRVLECSFGPIGRSGGRALIPGFGQEMKDWDGREVEITSLYHKQYANYHLDGHQAGDPFYWNFLEMEFDPREADGKIGLAIRNMIDAPDDLPRGGGYVDAKNSETGRKIASRLPEIKTLPNADVRFVQTDGQPIRGTRTLADGMVPVAGLVNVDPGTKVIVTAFDGKESKSQVVTTI